MAEKEPGNGPGKGEDPEKPPEHAQDHAEEPVKGPTEKTGTDEAGIQPIAAIPPGQTDGLMGPKPVAEGASDLIEVTDLTWESTVEKGRIPVAVMFYSPVCAFCHQMEPYFREYARNFKGSVLFARLNIMTNSWTPERYGVRSTPTFKFFCDGKPVQELVGAVYPAILKRIIDDVLVHGKECAKNSTAIDYEITGYG